MGIKKIITGSFPSFFSDHLFLSKINSPPSVTTIDKNDDKAVTLSLFPST